MSNAVKSYSRPYDSDSILKRMFRKRKPVSTDQLGLCRVRYYIDGVVADKQVAVIPWSGK